MVAYCLFCRTEKCDVVARILETRYDCRVLVPRIVQRKWIKGQPHEELHNYLPGYVFMYTEDPIEDFHELNRTEWVLRCLSTEKNQYQLIGNDRRFADMLYANNGTIGILKAVEEGQKVKLKGDLLAGFEAEIVRLDRRKGRAQVRFLFEGSEHKVWVGYDLIGDEVGRSAPRVEIAKEADEKSEGEA